MADPYVRHDTQIVVGVESEQGTAVSPTRTFGKVDGDTDLPDPTVEWLEERSISAGASRELTDKYAGQETFDGGSVPVVPTDGFPLAFVFGNDTVTADTNLDPTGAEVSESGTTLHTIDVLSAATPPTITVEATAFGRGGGDDFVRTFAGVVGPSVTLSVDNESRLSADIDLTALDIQTGTSSTSVAADDRNPWIFDDAESDLSINGSSYARVTDFEHELTSNVDTRTYIESSAGRRPFEHLYQNAEHELTVTVTPTDDALYQDLLAADDAGNATIQFSKPSTDEVLRYEASEIGIEEAPHSFPEEGAIEVGLTIIPNTVEVKVSDTQSADAYV